MKPSQIVTAAALSLSFVAPQARAEDRTPLVRVVDLDVGETGAVELCDGSYAAVKVLSLKEDRDDVRDAVRRARVDVEVNGKKVRLLSATYHLPVTAAGVRIDCPITRGYTTNANVRRWALEKDVRLRLWPAGSPLARPGTFGYPVRQRWFASYTQMANEPTFVDGGEEPRTRKVYYHWGLDFGGAEGMVDVVAATDGIVVSSGTEVLAGHEGTPVSPRYDVVYVRDGRGWYYRYSHLKTIEKGVRPGAAVKLGQKIGVIGKEGGSGGWSHLHFDVSSRQPSGKWGIQEAYALVWEAYLRERRPHLVAAARPHHLVWTGQRVTLDGSLSWSRGGGKLEYDWTFADGSRASGPRVERTYTKPGEYSEILRVTDADGRVDYDFAIVQVLDRARPGPITTIHPAYAPTFGIRPGDPVTFKVRSFREAPGEVWNFGDGTPEVKATSDGNADVHAADGYAVTMHRFAKPGDYIVRVQHVNRRGEKALGHLHVKVEEAAGERTGTR